MNTELKQTAEKASKTNCQNKLLTKLPNSLCRLPIPVWLSLAASDNSGLILNLTANS